MKSSFFLLIMCISLTLMAQTPTWEWARCAKTGVGPSSAAGEEVNSACDKEGNNYIVGFYRDTLIFGSDTLIRNSNGLLTGYIARYDSNGNPIWANTTEGSSNAVATSVATDIYGNVYWGGYYRQGSLVFDTITLNSPNGRGMFIAKFDTIGAIKWAMNFGDGIGEITDMITDEYGSVYISGFFNSPTISFDSFVLFNTDSSGMSSDFFVVKIDSTAAVQWAKTGAGNLVERAWNIAIDNNNNILVSGSFSSKQLNINGTILANQDSSTADIFLMKFNSSGNLLMVANAGGNDNDYPFGLAVTTANEIVLAGAFQSDSIVFGTGTLLPPDIPNIFILKFTSAGTPIWGKCGMSGRSFGRAVAIDNCDNIIAIGSMLSDTLIFDNIVLSLDSLNYDDSFILKLDPSGNFVWGTALPFGGDDYLTSATDSSGYVYISGDIAPRMVVLGIDTMFNNVSETPFVAKLNTNCTVGISELEVDNLIHIYPNPFKDCITIMADNDYITEGTLYDIQSRELLKFSFYNKIQLSNLNFGPGIYILQINQEKHQTHTYRIIEN